MHLLVNNWSASFNLAVSQFTYFWQPSQSRCWIKSFCTGFVINNHCFWKFHDKFPFSLQQFTALWTSQPQSFWLYKQHEIPYKSCHYQCPLSPRNACSISKSLKIQHDCSTHMHQKHLRANKELCKHVKTYYYNKCVWLQSCDWTPDHTIQQHIPDDSTFTVTAMGMPHLIHTHTQS